MTNPCARDRGFSLPANCYVTNAIVPFLTSAVSSGEEHRFSLFKDTGEMADVADRSNYADRPNVDGEVVEHRLRFGDEHRAYTPSSGETDNAGHFGGLSAGAGGDWSWQPARDKSFAQFEMPALKGTLKGMPEQLGRAREAAGEPGAILYGNSALPVRRNPKLIPGVNGGRFFDTSAGCQA